MVRRDGVARQLRGRLSTAGQANDLNIEASEDYHTLTACIECYACLHECPMHARNFEKAPPPDRAPKEQAGPTQGYAYGNPFSLLKLQRLRTDPLTSDAGVEAAMDNAMALGLHTCIDCKGCKCGIGIDLMGKVIRPLLDSVNDRADAAT